MILNHLAKAYDEIVKNPNAEITRSGFSFEKVPYIAVINDEGNLIDIVSNTKTVGGEVKIERVPERIQRAGVNPNFLYDTLTYMFGLEVVKEEVEVEEVVKNEVEEVVKNEIKDEEIKNEEIVKGEVENVVNEVEREEIEDKEIENSGKSKLKTEKVLKQTDKATKSFEMFKNKILDDLKDVNSPCATAIKKFYNNWQPDPDNEHFYEIKDDNSKQLKNLSLGIIVFALNSIANKSIDDEEILKQWEKIKFTESDKDESAIFSQCCISGETAEISRIHNSIKGLKGAQSVGATIVSYNDLAFESYNKKQSFNGPVSVDIMKKYTAALNYLLRKESKNKITFGNDTLVFWAESITETTTNEFLELINMSATKSEEQDVESKVALTLKQIKAGKKLDAFETPDEMKYHILLLSPNAARIAIRRYYNTTFGELKDNMIQHYLDMELYNANGKEQQISFWQILDATISSVITVKRAFNPNYFGALTNSAFNNLQYPSEIFTTMIARVKTDNPNVEDSGLKKAKIQSLSYRRIAFIKAYLVRKERNNKKEVFKMDLNKEITNEAYLLGRLFAVMEKAQKHAIPGINSTIKDRYFASACATPASVFPTLIIGYQNHIAKLKDKQERTKGYIRYEKLFGEIFSKLGDFFTKQLDLDGQGRFIIGYYQQWADLWKKQETSENKEEK